MCEPQKLNALDILGVALQADNELVKRERILKQSTCPNPFDYSEEQPEYRNTETKSYIASTGFTYTEIVPQNSTPLPDDDSPSMSLASRYGGMIPRSQSVAPNASKVCVKTTRYILKKHVFVSPALKVDTTLPSTTVTSIAGNTYDTAC
jgi:hypothetical protein